LEEITETSGLDPQGQRFCIFEVETADTIGGEHTSDQWTLFGTYANEHNAEFWVVVPGGSASLARLRLDELGLRAQVWEV
jgi:hypothetical protein